MKIYIIEIEPLGYVRRTRADAWKKRPVVNKYYSYKNLLAYLLNRMGYNQSNSLEIVFHLPIPKSLSKTKINAINGKPHNKKPDIDNLVKAFLDTATKQDSFVYKIKASKFYSLNPKIIIIQ